LGELSLAEGPESYLVRLITLDVGIVEVRDPRAWVIAVSSCVCSSAPSGWNGAGV
jgi:hypothetical protein